MRTRRESRIYLRKRADLVQIAKENDVARNLEKKLHDIYTKIWLKNVNAGINYQAQQEFFQDNSSKY